MATAPEASRTVQLRLGDGLWQALQERCSRSGESTMLSPWGIRALGMGRSRSA